MKALKTLVKYNLGKVILNLLGLLLVVITGINGSYWLLALLFVITLGLTLLNTHLHGQYSSVSPTRAQLLRLYSYNWVLRQAEEVVKNTGRGYKAFYEGWLGFTILMAIELGNTDEKVLFKALKVHTEGVVNVTDLKQVEILAKNFLGESRLSVLKKVANFHLENYKRNSVEFTEIVYVIHALLSSLEWIDLEKMLRKGKHKTKIFVDEDLFETLGTAYIFVSKA
jgi:hypothetical protein